ncbi:2-polyprenylphenol 6-hydroxylase [Amorphus orientalis]|uniref:Ubiquinone biosynthesis protein n=1 Tax=Amorphus orientalis TaxID=649198 RepID=A0AAE4AS00_9HYPH|nr:2-polyprenylphenol 6-hydroxylase [Amorphus orientalis]MDQ0314652.1 ubiquinone biosynthesis protein [Amorphus orientalis]
MALRIAPLLRLVHAGFVLAREGVFGLVVLPDLPPSARFGIRVARLLERRGAKRTEAAVRLTQALNRLGPSYVKLGQFLATRADVVGADAARELAKLQDEVPPISDETARKAIEEGLDRTVEEAFVEFGPAVAAASIAQVHRATVRDRDGGIRTVAVKVLRPGVAGRFARDLESFYMAARLIERFVPHARRLRPVAVVDTLAWSVHLEMDLRLEAAALSEMAENCREDPGFRVPSVDWARTSKTILSMEWIEGIKLSKIEAIREAGIDLEQLAETVMQSFLRHAVRDGFFHADMHPGNLFVEPDGTLVAVDFGITGRLNAAERSFLARILYGFIRRDYRLVAQVHFEAGYVPADQDPDVFAQALRAIGEPIRDQTAQDISMARLLTQLFEVTELFAMTTQPRLIMLQKTMVVVEGVARSLDPKLDMWHVAEPVMRTWVETNIGPARRLQEAGEGLAAFVRLMAEFPDFVDKVSRMSHGFSNMAETGLTLAVDTVDHIAEAEARRTRSRQAALWLGALSLFAIAISVVFG